MPLSVVVNVNGKTAVFSLSAPDNATTWSHAARWSPDAERDRGPLRPSATATSEPSTGRESGRFSVGDQRGRERLFKAWCVIGALTRRRRGESSPAQSVNLVVLPPEGDKSPHVWQELWSFGAVAAAADLSTFSRHRLLLRPALRAKLTPPCGFGSATRIFFLRSAITYRSRG
jgi:hypothetical protein